ncbi:MAG: enoyl-CoA hydratase-related protein [Ornithinimicrobium sp.]
MSVPSGVPRPERRYLQVTRLGEGDHIVEVALNRPEAMNAISTAFAAELAGVMTQVAADPTVRVVLLTSTAVKAFCVGADLKERAQMNEADLMAHRDISREGYRGVLRLPMPAVAAIEGYALGGGLELALSCDLIVAGQDSTVGLPEVSVGLIPGGGGTQLLTRRVGWARAASMVFTAQRFQAEEAAALGVIDEVVPAGTARERALTLAQQIAHNSPISVRNAKSAMRAGFDVDLMSGLDIEDVQWRATARSQDRGEGITAFNEKRPPKWHTPGTERD